MFLCILGVEHIEVNNGEQVFWIGSSMVSEWEVNFLPFSKYSRRWEFVAQFWHDTFFPILYRSWQAINLKWLYHTSYSPKLQFKTFI